MGLTRFLWIAIGLCGVSAMAIVLPHPWKGLRLPDTATGAGNILVLVARLN